MSLLSAVVITLNEEKKISRCLESLQGVADEIVVVDSLSTDKTKEICLGFGVKFVEQKFLGYTEQKNFAVRQSSHNYVLCIDADEVLSDSLRQSILAIKPNLTEDAYSFNRLTNYAGFWVKHCGWYPDRSIRIFHREKAYWGGENPHDKVLLRSSGSKVHHISGDLFHYSYDSVTDHVAQTNRFTTIAARAAYQNGTRSNILKIVGHPLFCFIKCYFFRLGFLDGKYGLVISSINTMSVLLKYTKIRELQENKPI